MANPQLEDGYTRIANEILEAVAKAKFNGTQYKILLAVWRYTYGFNRKEYEFSLSFLSEVTGCNKHQIKRELKRLIDSKVLLVTQEADFNSPRTLCFNKHYNEWDIESTQCANSHTGSESVQSTVCELAHSTGSELAHHIKTIYKDNIKDIEEDDDNKGTPFLETTNPDKVPSHCQEDDPVLTFLNQVSSYYTSLTGRFASPSDEVAITEIAKHTTDFQLVKEAMDMTFKNYKPRYKGDKIRAFRYFVPAILERLAAEEEKRKLKEAGVKVANGDDNVLGEKTSRASGFDKSKFLYQGGG